MAAGEDKRLTFTCLPIILVYMTQSLMSVVVSLPSTPRAILFSDIHFLILSLFFQNSSF